MAADRALAALASLLALGGAGGCGYSSLPAQHRDVVVLSPPVVRAPIELRESATQPSLLIAVAPPKCAAEIAGVRSAVEESVRMQVTEALAAARSIDVADRSTLLEQAGERAARGRPGGPRAADYVLRGTITTLDRGVHVSERASQGGFLVQGSESAEWRAGIITISWVLVRVDDGAVAHSFQTSARLDDRLEEESIHFLFGSASSRDQTRTPESEGIRTACIEAVNEILSYARSRTKGVDS
jgi:curli biogenesis system outer membrane secretion channel CsgG